ncbi:MAG: ribosome hibernation-promoting factor, HPF/YfiA family [Bacteriovorax sp.]
MRVLSSFLHFDHSPALDEKIQEASAKMSKFFNGEGSMKWSCYVKNGVHNAEVNYVAPHFEYHAKASSDNMYESIDKALCKIERQVFKQKDKFNKLHRGKLRLVMDN